MHLGIKTQTRVLHMFLTLYHDVVYIPTNVYRHIHMNTNTKIHYVSHSKHEPVVMTVLIPGRERGADNLYQTCLDALIQRF